MERLKILQRDCEMTGKAILIKWLAIPSDLNPNDFFIFPRALSALTVSMALNSNWTVFSLTIHSLDRRGLGCGGILLKTKVAVAGFKVIKKAQNRFLVVGLNTLFCRFFSTGTIVKQISTLNCYPV